MSSIINQRGQVLVLGLIMVGLLSTAYLYYFSNGRVLANKTRLVHATDAAVYSGALVQARSLNLISYLNRAQLAHQIAMAHLISLASWANYGATQSQRLSMANPPAHLIGMLFGADYGQAYLSAAHAAGLTSSVKNHGDLARAFAGHESFIHDDIQDINQSLIQNLPEFRLAVIKNVLSANFPEIPSLDIDIRLIDDDWPKPIVFYKSDNDVFHLLKKLSDLYGFLEPRNFTKKNSWSVDARCPSLRHQLRRRGNTILNASGQWQSSDVQSFHALRSNRWIGCYYREYAMGWAWLPAAHGANFGGIYVAEPPENFSNQNFWNWVQSHSKLSYLDDSDNPLANSYAVRDAIHWSNRGLAAYLDTKNGLDSTGFRIASQIKTNNNDLIKTTSAAKTVFARPSSRTDGLHESANLFHPYWRASLANSIIDIGRQQSCKKAKQ